MSEWPKGPVPASSFTKKQVCMCVRMLILYCCVIHTRPNTCVCMCCVYACVHVCIWNPGGYFFKFLHISHERMPMFAWSDSLSSNVLKWITSANVDSKITAWYTTPFKLQLELFSEDIPHTLLWYTYNRGTKWPWVIGASLSEPHITVTAFAEVVCMYVWPYTVNFRWAHVNISWRLNVHE